MLLCVVNFCLFKPFVRTIFGKRYNLSNAIRDKKAKKYQEKKGKTETKKRFFCKKWIPFTLSNVVSKSVGG